MWLGVYLLYCVLQESSGCTVERGKGPDITGSVGDTVVLPCSCEKNKPVDLQTVQWGYKKKFVGGVYTVEQSVVSKDGSVDQRYRDRVQITTQNPPGQVSLIIPHLTEKDEGRYVCGNDKYIRVIILHVGGCSMVGQGHTLTRSSGESVLLPCPCPRSGYVKPERVTWSYTKAGSSDRTPVSNDAGSYRGRVWTFDQTGSRNLSLLISDLTKENEGQYTCTSDQHSAYVTLQIKGCALVENKQTATVSRSSGESVLLSCTCAHLPEDTPVTVQWRGPRYKDLVQTFTRTSPGNLSVLISDLTVEDEGTYSCWINQNQYRTFTLTVKGCTLSQTQANQIIRYPGESVLLPCSCTDPNTRPGSVKWERVDPGGTEGSSKMEINSDRVQMFNKIHPANLSLLISELTEQDQGTYRCSTNKQSISIRLSITAGTSRSTTTSSTTSTTNNNSLPGLGGTWVIIIIICAVLLILLLLGGGAACIERKRIQGRKQRKDKDTGQRTNQADDDYENDPRNISMGQVYQSLDPKTNQSDSVYQSLNPKTNQSDSVYQSLDPKTNQSDSVYQSLNPKTNQSDSVYQSLDPRTN